MWRIASLSLVVATACGFEGNDPPRPDAPTVSFEFPTSNADETTTALRVRVFLDHEYDTQVAVSYLIETGNGNAEKDVDYTIADPTNRITFKPGDREHFIIFTMIDDGIEEGEEKIDLTLAEPDGLFIGKERHTVQISNDILPRARFTAGMTALPEDDSVDIAITLDKASMMDVTVDVQIVASDTTASDADHTLMPTTTIMIPAGQLGANIPFPITVDTLDEDDEIIALALGAPSAGVIVSDDEMVNRRFHTINDDDDAPSVGFLETTTTSAEGTDFSFIVRLSAPSGKTITVPFTRSGSADNDEDAELTTPGTSLTFAPGVVEQSITFDSKPDGAYDEEDETVIVTLGPPTNATLGDAIRTHTLVDQDPTPTISFLSGDTFTFIEGDSGDPFQNFGIDINGSSSRTITITVTFTAAASNGAVLGDDYRTNPSPVTFTIPPGDSAQRSFRVTVESDNSNENDESFTMDVGDPTNAARGQFPTRTVTINDDDGGP